MSIFFFVLFALFIFIVGLTQHPSGWGYVRWPIGAALGGPLLTLALLGVLYTFYFPLWKRFFYDPPDLVEQQKLGVESRRRSRWLR